MAPLAKRSGGDGRRLDRRSFLERPDQFEFLLDESSNSFCGGIFHALILKGPVK